MLSLKTTVATVNLHEDMFSMCYMCCPVLSRALESMGSVKEPACPPQMMDLPWYFYKSIKGQNSHREFQRWALGSRIVNYNMTVSLSKEARYGNFPSSCTQKRPESGLAYSLGEEFRWLPELQNNTPVLIYACLPF